MPVKCTTPPFVFTTRPPSAVTSPIHAAQPRPSRSGARIASTKPGAGVASGLRNTSRSPLRGARAGVRARREAGVAPVCRDDRPPARARARAASVSSLDALSTTTSSSPRPSCATSAGSEAATAARLLYVTTTTDRRVAASGTSGRGMLASGRRALGDAARLACQARTTDTGTDDRNLGGRRRFSRRPAAADPPCSTCSLIDRSSCLAVVPAYNEAATVGDVVAALHRKAPQLDVAGDRRRLDGRDRASVAERAGARVLRMPFNLGIGGAVQAGFKYADEHGYDYMVQVDGDGQHDPGEIAKLFARRWTATAPT